VNTNVEGGVGIEMAGLAGSGAVRVMEVGWPSGAALRGVVSNHRALRPLTAVRGERHGKGAPVSASGVDREDGRKRTVSDVSKLIQLTSKPGSAPHPGMSLGDTRLLLRRCPAYRQHEPDPGSRMERVKVSPRNCSREMSGDERECLKRQKPQEVEYRLRGTLADWPVVAMKPGNSGGAKGLGRPWFMDVANWKG
jgi:hypothetical protein